MKIKIFPGVGNGGERSGGVFNIVNTGQQSSRAEGADVPAWMGKQSRVLVRGVRRRVVRKKATSFAHGERPSFIKTNEQREEKVGGNAGVKEQV